MKFKAQRSLPGDIERLNLKDCFSSAEIENSKMMVDYSRKSDDSLCASFYFEGRLVGVAGSFRQWDGVAQFWALFDEEVDKYPIALTKVCNALILYAVETQKLRRVSLNVISDYTNGNRFARCLGFDFEGRMYGFFQNGKDANLYARLF